MGLLRPVVITGVSSGIGKELASFLVRQGYTVFGTVRKNEDAIPLKREFGDHFTPLIMDITIAEQIVRAYEQVTATLGPNGTLAALVNNAGIAVNGPLMHVPVAELRRQFETNVIGTLQVSQTFFPLLKKNVLSGTGPGRIINISSTSGRIASPFLGPYAASKHALEAIGDVMRRELCMYGIHVVTIQPSSIDTPIWNKTEAITPYKDTDYAACHQSFLENAPKSRKYALPVYRAVKVIYKALLSKDPNPRYVVTASYIRSWLIPRFSSDRYRDKIYAKRFKFRVTD